MHIKISVMDLSESLNCVTRAISARPAKAILSGVLFETIEDGVLLTCTDGTITLRARMEANVLKAGKSVLPGRLLLDLVRKLPSSEVDIQINEKNVAIIKCAPSRTTLACMNGVEFPAFTPSEGVAGVQLSQADLRDMIQKVIFAVGTDESRQILTGCLLEITREETRLVALDGFRLAMQKCAGQFICEDEERQSIKAVIPGRVMSEIGKILDDADEPIHVMLDNARMYATFGAVEISSVLLVGEYIDYRKILPTEWETRIKLKRVELHDALERVSLIAREGKTNLVKLHMDASYVTINSNAEMGDAVETVMYDIDGPELDIAFNARYISDIIRSIEDEEVCLFFGSSVSPCVISPLKEGKYVYLLLPVRTF